MGNTPVHARQTTRRRRAPETYASPLAMKSTPAPRQRAFMKIRYSHAKKRTQAARQRKRTQTTVAVCNQTPAQQRITVRLFYIVDNQYTYRARQPLPGRSPPRHIRLYTVVALSRDCCSIIVNHRYVNNITAGPEEEAELPRCYGPDGVSPRLFTSVQFVDK